MCAALDSWVPSLFASFEELLSASDVWGSDSPHVATEHEREPPKVSEWHPLMKNNFSGPFCFVVPTVTGDIFLAMMEKSALRHDQLHSAPLVVFVTFWTGGFLISG
jgi:hypothetical protein